MRHDPTFDIDAFDPVADRDRLADATAPTDVRATDLRDFRDRGGKLLMYQGWNDYPLRPKRAIDYLADVKQSMGEAETDSFFRLFMVPGSGPLRWRPRRLAGRLRRPASTLAGGRRGPETDRRGTTGAGVHGALWRRMPGSCSRAASAGRCVRIRRSQAIAAKAMSTPRRASTVWFLNLGELGS